MNGAVRWIEMWRLGVAFCMLVTLFQLELNGFASTLVTVYFLFAVVAVVAHRWRPSSRSVEGAIHAIDVCLVALALVSGLIPVFLSFVHLITAGAFVFGPFGAGVTATALLPILPFASLELTSSAGAIASLLVAAMILITASFHRQRMLRETVGPNLLASERVRIARELHDGPLQSVIGARMLLQTQPAAASEVIGASIENVRQELQSLIRYLRPAAQSPEESRFTTRLHLLALEVKRQWNVDLELNEIPSVMDLPKERRREVRQLIRECVINAAKHSQGRKILVSGVLDDNSLRLTVSDDGRGFEFKGRYDMNDLRRIEGSPVTLRERIEQIGGDLTILSSDSGSTLSIRIPLQEAT
jgi:signal transduction histidine kinase